MNSKLLPQKQNKRATIKILRYNKQRKFKMAPTPTKGNKTVTKSSQAVTVTPQKRMKRIYKATTKKSYLNKETVFTELVVNGTVLVLTIKKIFSKEKQQPGYMKPIHDVCIKGEPDIDGILSPAKLDISYKNHLIMRVSHEGNERLKNGYKREGSSFEYSECAAVAYPNPDYYAIEGVFDIKSEEKARNDFVQVLCEKEGKIASNSFTDWNHHDSRTKLGEYRSLDKILTDESVAHFLQVHFLPEDISYTNVYNYMQKEDLKNFFSRRESDGRYNKFPVEYFGFPNDTLIS
jgi:hypothetical protein